MSKSVLLERQGRVATLVLNRPPLNILDLASISAFSRALEELTNDDDLQILLIRGAGSQAFSAGVAVQDHTPDRVREMLSGFHAAIRALRRVPAVTVAVVKGHCLGGGMELAASCDMVAATDDSSFGQPEIKLGCYPPLAAVLYPRLFGAAATCDLLLTGRTIDCSEAEEIGLVTRRASRPEFETVLAELVDGISEHSAAVTRVTIRAIRASRAENYDQALAESERLYLEELANTSDMNEGINAFIQKRTPVWKHR